ncbi:DUF1795 domain-containing protein [Lampropedia aestuarii]|uniref:DUF1795 domain-containing protein n=1 Tax=Lampropedia aestuarii TaxID=2562762 RepID=A0A4S5BLS1_9BURK|nr:DcrB-related protein [Lampropedia aestuarii]THJ30658.1 DUF1795 domain-containing protein [Lampropedia aestuarii]
MKYLINEGILEIPDNLIDRSVNMLVTQDGKEVSYTISRDKLQTAEPLTAFIDRQLSDLSRQVSKFVESERIEINFKKSAQTGYQITSSFKQNGREYHQKQMVLVLKDQESVLVVTGTSFEPWSSKNMAAWQSLLKNSELH